MKAKIAIQTILLLLIFCFCSGYSQQQTTVVAPTSDAAEGLDLRAISELFKDTKNLKSFERSLNDPDVGVNNLDLDENGQVDFIRVIEKSNEDSRVIILQAALGKDEFQDVATIEVEKKGNEQYNMQVHGNEILYGAEYYVAPVQVHVRAWPIIRWIYRPNYHPYRSVFYFGYYPVWWKPFRPVRVNVYRTRNVRYTRKTTFTITRTRRVHTTTKIKYMPRSSTRVVKRTRFTRKPAGPKKTTVTTHSVKRTNNKTGRTTTIKRKKTTRKRNGKKTTVVRTKRTTVRKKRH